MPMAVVLLVLCIANAMFIACDEGTFADGPPPSGNTAATSAGF